MKTNQIVEIVLNGLNVDPTEEKIFVLVTLIKEKEIKRSKLIKLLVERGLYNHQAVNLLQSLNKKDVVKWTIVSGVAFVKLTEKAKKEILAVEVESLKQELGEEFEKKISHFEKGFEEFVSSVKKEGKELEKEVVEGLANHLVNLANKIRPKK
jgi:hypothetical protein